MTVCILIFSDCQKENEKVSSVTGVTVTPATSDVPKGYGLEFIATIDGDKLTKAEKAVTWTVTGDTKQATTITTAGILTITENVLYV